MHFFLGKNFFLRPSLFSSRFNLSEGQSFSISLLLKLIDTAIERSHLMFLLHKFRPCLTEQPSRRDLPQFDGAAKLKTELSNWFPGSLLLNENIASGFPKALGSRDELHINLSRLEWSAWVRCALAPLFCVATASLFPEAMGVREESEFSSPSSIFSGEASISRNCSTSRSESAMLSAEPWSECILDWTSKLSTCQFLF